MQATSALRSRLPVDGFVGAMLLVVAAAFAAPWLGADGGPLHLSQILSVGIGAVFFMHGASLAPAALRAGIAQWRLHLLIQATSFIVFPAIGLAVYFGMQTHLPAEVRLAFLFLCAVSSTISSSVALTALARGNVSAAVFNATLSGLIGMVATPTVMALAQGAGGGMPPLGSAVRSILLTLLLPFATGRLFHSWLWPWIAPRKARLAWLDRGVILAIIYTAFCNSVAAGLWSRHAWFTLSLMTGLAAGLLFAVLALVRAASRRLGFNRADEVAAVFCGSQKSLASGAPIAKILLGGHPTLGMIMLPLMIYHQLQLVTCAVLARRYAALAELEAEARMPAAVERPA